MLASNRRQRLGALPIALFLALSILTISPGRSAAAPNASFGVGAGQGTTVKTLSLAQSYRDRRLARLADIDRALGVAAAQRGDRYAYGGTGPSSFDCSGFIQYVFGRAGISVPRTSSAQYAALRHIKKSNLRKGDLLYFSSGGRVYHAGIYWGRDSSGNRLIMHSSRPGTPVGVSRIWTSGYGAATLRLGHR